MSSVDRLLPPPPSSPSKEDGQRSATCVVFGKENGARTDVGSNEDDGATEMKKIKMIVCV